MDKKTKNIIKLVFLLIVFAITTYCYWYFRPIEESLSCNSDFICTSKIVRYFNITKQEVFQINANSILTLEEHHIPGAKSARNGVYYSFISNGNIIKPFVYYSCSSYNCMYTGAGCCYQILDKDIRAFEAYKQNSKLNFSLKSQAEDFNFVFNTILLIIFIVTLGVKLIK